MLYLQATRILPIKFRVNGPFGSGEVQNRFPRLSDILDFQSERF